MPWARGQSGNPQGRRLYKAWRDALRRKLFERGPDGRRNLDLAAEALIAQALTGHMGALRELGDRLDGKPRKCSTATIGNDRGGYVRYDHA